MNKSFRLLLALACLLTLGFGPTPDDKEGYWERQLRLYGKVQLPVKAIQQEKITSCGEAAITMAYNYAYPEDKVTEEEVIEYAAEKGYYTERKFPFTSPADMPKVAGQFADVVEAGTVRTEVEGLALLTEKLSGGDPVIIDILTRLDDPGSGAHFVVVTGITIDSKNPNKTKIHFNDPQLGKNRSAYWTGREGVWNAWANNNDPGGSGWWMVLPSP